MQEFEKMGSFYLGKKHDPTQKVTGEEYLLYDSKDLCTHAITVGMTGSGKTGLGIGILEEAAMDGIPALIIDPKGDMTNLMLGFPDLAPENFKPWLNLDEATQKGMDLDSYADKVSSTWRDGLAKWGQDGARIRAMQEKVTIEVYTPGSTAGKQISMLASIDLPSRAILEDYEALSEFASATASSMLSLVGIDSDPLTGREHILLNNILINAWQQGRSLDLASFIQLIHQPGIEQFGVLPLNSFYPEQERFALAMRFNNLLASPQFAVWMQGEPLDVQSLLFDPQGKPKLSILSINHLNDQERMFFVSTFLNRVISWVRAQSGTSSLRALLYMDEIFGYFPPIANPPSKKPLLSLLKQARAFGLGVVLSTQNPVDLDYKGLANIGTWFIGRLQTEQDKARLLDGLESANQNTAQSFNRQEMDAIISGLSSRVFLMNNVHEDAPVLFETRWAMSYLAGPLTKRQIASFRQEGGQAVSSGSAVQSMNIPTPEVQAPAQQPILNMQTQPPASPETPAASSTSNLASGSASKPAMALTPSMPEGVEQYFMPMSAQGNNVCYLPSLIALVETTFVNSKNAVNLSEKTIWNTPITSGMVAVDWANKTMVDVVPSELEKQAVYGVPFKNIPDSVHKKTSYSGWMKDLVDYLYREQTLQLFENPFSKIQSKPGESQRDFVSRIQLEARELRDVEIEKLRDKYAKKIQALEEKVRKAEQRVEKEKSQANQAKFSSMLDFGSTILGGFLGRKALSKANLNKAAASVRSAGRAKQQGTDVELAQDTLDTYKQDLAALEGELQTELDALAQNYEQRLQEVQPLELRPKKTDISVRALSVLWLPYDENGGQFTPLFRQLREE